MKSFYPSLFVLFALFFLSCSGDTEKDKVRIGFSQCIDKHPWRDAMNNSMKLQASLHSNVELTVYEARVSATAQISHINKMIDDEMDAIIVSPLDPNLIAPVVEKAYAKGIPVILIDRKINSTSYTTYIGADNIEIGRNAGKLIASAATKPVNVIEIKGGDNSSPVLERSLGFHQVVDGLPNINVIASITGTRDGVPYELFSKTLDSLKGTRIDYAYVFSDEMAEQARKMTQVKGLENQIKFMGVDGLNGPDGGIQMVLDGRLVATILYPTGGNEVIELALRILNGEKVAKNNVLATTVIDRFNAEIMKNQYDKINEQQAYLEEQIIAIKTQEKQYYAQNKLLKITMALLVIILSLTLYTVYSIFVIRKKNRQLLLTNKKITVQRNQIEKIANEVKVSNEAKLNFFMGLSHEFKTPITLILSSIESISEVAKEKGSKLMNEVELIYNNSNRLLRLINQLLDFRKVEDRKFALRASKTNLYTFSKNIFKDFEREAKKRSINFNLNCNNEDLDVFIDRDLIDKVYFNLLSNSFKFTPDNGRIEISILDDAEKNTVSIHFKDTGIGIPEKEMKNVFQAFFRGSNNRKNSSGIGLHLSKQFTELHKGKIIVKSFHGSEFIVTLYKGKAHLNDDELIVEHDLTDNNIIDFSPDFIADDTYLNQPTEENKEKYSILIIEDNRDLSHFLKNKLMLEYEIHLSDGTDAIEKAFEVIPDITICDILLADKNGFEICEILKKDLRTSHIPTIILTALGNKESYLKGLQSGADLYLTKPFSFSILMQSIKSLLYNREKLRYYYTNNIYKIEQTDSFGNMEQQFVNRLNILINENLDNADFSVEHLAEDLNISRVQLYRKVKAMLGISVSDYISNFRLEKAKSMLESTSLRISEIAYANGFSSPNYFSTTFKNKYGTSPVLFRKSILN